MRRWSSQVSQCRRSSSSYTRADEGLPAASSIFLLQASSALHSGYTSEVTRSVRLSTQRTPPASVERDVTLRGSPPARSSTNAWLSPSRLETNAIRVPSGLKRGRVSAFG